MAKGRKNPCDSLVVLAERHNNPSSAIRVAGFKTHSAWQVGSHTSPKGR